MAVPTIFDTSGRHTGTTTWWRTRGSGPAQPAAHTATCRARTGRKHSRPGPARSGRRWRSSRRQASPGSTCIWRRSGPLSNSSRATGRGAEARRGRSRRSAGAGGSGRCSRSRGTRTRSRPRTRSTRRGARWALAADASDAWGRRRSRSADGVLRAGVGRFQRPPCSPTAKRCGWSTRSGSTWRRRGRTHRRQEDERLPTVGQRAAGRCGALGPAAGSRV